MKGIIFRNEFGVLIRSPRFRWSTLVLLLLLAAGLFNGISYYKVESQRRSAAAAATYQQWLDQGAKNPHSAAHYGFYAYKPVSGLAILDKGLDDYMGNTVWLEAHNQNEAKARNISDNLSLSRFGELTIGMVLSLFVPLLIILLGYNNISAEKENGTLRMLFSTRASARQVMAGKFMALMTISLIWLLGTMLIVGTALAVVHVQEGGRMALHLLLITCLLLISYATVSLVITSLSAWSKQSAVSLVSGTAFWIIMAIVSPRLISMVADVLYPVSTAFAFQQAVEFDKENGLDGHSPVSDRSKQFEQEVLKKYGVDSLSKLPVNFAGLSLQAGEEQGDKIYDKHYTALRTILAKQDNTIDLLSVFSPLMAQQGLLHGFCETDLERQNSFIIQAENQRRKMQRLLNGDYARGGAGKDKYLRSTDLWRQVKNFQFKEPSTGSILKQQSPNMLVLLIWLLISGGCFMQSSKTLKSLN